MSNTSDNSVYVILVNDDNSMTVTQKKRIVQRSKLVDDLWFLVNPEYSGHNMGDFTVMMEYLSPVSHKYRTEFLTKNDDTYNGYLKYTLPIDTQITSEAGDVEIQLTFAAVKLDENGKGTQYVRKITKTTITVVPVSAWSDIIPDCALSALDQRIIKMDAQIKALNETNELLFATKADDISYNKYTNELQLMSDGDLIGKSVVLDTTSASLENGVPVINFDRSKPTPDDYVDNDDIIEF